MINFILGTGFLLGAGDSVGQGIRRRNPVIFVFGLVELCVGMYYTIAAIGAATL